MKRTDLYRKTDFPILAIQLLIMVTFGLASLTKWQAGGVPPVDHKSKKRGR